MSVAEYSFERIEAIYAGIQGLRPKMPITAAAEALQDALRAAYYANRAALGCSYNRDMKLLRCPLPKGFNPKAMAEEVYRDIGLLLYNCVSNGGRDFMPEQDRYALEGVRLEIAEHVMSRASPKELKAGLR